jgi:hypothetical protein
MVLNANSAPAGPADLPEQRDLRGLPLFNQGDDKSA